MKKMLATLLTGAMIVSAGSVMVQAEEVDKSQSTPTTALKVVMNG